MILPIRPRWPLAHSAAEASGMIRSATPGLTIDLPLAEAVILEAEMSDLDVLVDTVHDLMRRGFKRDLADALRLVWVGSTTPLSVPQAERFHRSGRVKVTVTAPVPDAESGDPRHTSAKLGTQFLRPGEEPADSYAFAKTVFDVALLEDNISSVATDCGVTVMQATVYHRRFARLLAELEGISGATEADAKALWGDVWGLHPNLLGKPWTKSPPRMFEILAGTLFPRVAP